MSTKNDAPMIEQLLSRQYPVQIHHIAEEDTPGYYLAFLPDFGQSACSATGDTMPEAIERLSDVKRAIVQHYLDTGREIPEPSKGPHDAAVLQQMPLRLPKDIHDRLKQRAENSGMSLNAYATRVFVEHLTVAKIIGWPSRRTENQLGDAKEKIKMMDETKKLPLTIENAIAAVARECNLVTPVLSGSMDGEGRVMVTPKDSRRMVFLVVTRDVEEKEMLKIITESIQADSLLDDLEDLDSKAIYEALAKVAVMPDLESWLVAGIREQIRSLAQNNDAKFWDLWKESGLKPFAVNGSRGLAPGFDLVKALQRYQIQDLSKLGQLLLEMVDFDYENACDIILEQCQIDIPSLATALLKAAGGVEGMSDGTFTPEGFVIHAP